MSDAFTDAWSQRLEPGDLTSDEEREIEDLKAEIKELKEEILILRQWKNNHKHLETLPSTHPTN